MCSLHSNAELPHYAPVEDFGCVSVIALKGVHCNKLALRSEKKYITVNQTGIAIIDRAAVDKRRQHCICDCCYQGTEI